MKTAIDRIDNALAVALHWGNIDGSHHKAWAIDQIVRALLDCPEVEGDIYGENGAYKEFVSNACAGDDGPETYDWDVGIAP